MTRHLTVARARVAPEHEAAYLAALEDLARLAEAGGRHCWVFRDPRHPGTFLEFREWGDGAPAPSEAETRLEARLREWSDVAPGADTIWEEVRRATPRPGSPPRS